MNISQEVQNKKEKLIKRRRDLHRHPESGWIEYRTSAIIAEELTQLGYHVFVGKDVCKESSRMGVPDPEILRYHEQRAIGEGAGAKWIERMKGGFTGVVGVRKTGRPGPVIALRFDIDSNDLQESASADHRAVREGFASTHQGMMHACGHDGHTAIGLGVAEILATYEHLLSGEIRLLFQPAEEGSRGAKAMVDAGWLDGVDYFFSGHIAFKSEKMGEIVATVGGFLATSKIDVTFQGRAAHAGADPEKGKNALLAAAAATTHLHGISRHSGGATRINVGTLEAGSGRNVIPERAFLQIETRGETSELNEYMKSETIRVVENIARVFDVSCKWEIVGEASGAQSSTELASLITREAEQMKLVNSIVPYLDLGGSEDVVYMLNRVQERGGKATYMLFGSPLAQGHHQTGFDFDEDVLLVGTEIMSRVVFACQP